jgi:tetratricopeptide (TPR) repeat protein
VNARLFATSLLVVLALLAPAGCASWPAFKAAVPDVAPMRKARSAQLIKEYEQHRDEAQYQAALSAWKQGNSEGCQELITTLLERNPEHRGARLLMVQLHMLEQEFTEARAEADKLAHDLPADAEVLHVQGLVCEAAGELEQAEKCYRRAVELNPKDQTFAASLASIAEADLLNTAEAGNARLHKRPTGTPDADRLSAALLKAEVHLALGEADAAQRLVQNALAQMPAQAELESLLARICQVTGKSADVAAHSERAEQHPSSRRVQPAGYDAGAKQPERAIDHPQAIATDEPIQQPIQQSAFAAASASATRSASLKSAELKRSQASVAETLRRGETALAGDTPAMARSHFQRAIAAAPDDESVPVSAAVAALRHNHPELAAELAQSALPRWPKSAALYRTLGMAEYRLEHWQAAQAALRQALSLDNSQALSYFLLGCTLSKLGQDQEAERNFSQARQLDTRYALKP